MRSWARWSRAAVGITAMAALSLSIAACPSSVRTARSAIRRTLAFALITAPEFTNGSFEAGLEGWTVQGHIGVRTSDPVRPAPDGTTVVVFNGDDEASVERNDGAVDAERLQDQRAFGGFLRVEEARDRDREAERVGHEA